MEERYTLLASEFSEHRGLEFRAPGEAGSSRFLLLQNHLVFYCGNNRCQGKLKTTVDFQLPFAQYVLCQKPVTATGVCSSKRSKTIPWDHFTPSVKAHFPLYYNYSGSRMPSTKQRKMAVVGSRSVGKWEDTGVSQESNTYRGKWLIHRAQANLRSPYNSLKATSSRATIPRSKTPSAEYSSTKARILPQRSLTPLDRYADLTSYFPSIRKCTSSFHVYFKAMIRERFFVFPAVTHIGFWI